MATAGEQDKPTLCLINGMLFYLGFTDGTTPEGIVNGRTPAFSWLESTARAQGIITEGFRGGMSREEKVERIKESLQEKQAQQKGPLPSAGSEPTPEYYGNNPQSNTKVIPSKRASASTSDAATWSPDEDGRRSGANAMRCPYKENGQGSMEETGDKSSSKRREQNADRSPVEATASETPTQNTPPASLATSSSTNSTQPALSPSSRFNKILPSLDSLDSADSSQSAQNTPRAGSENHNNPPRNGTGADTKNTPTCTIKNTSDRCAEQGSTPPLSDHYSSGGDDVSDRSFGGGGGELNSPRSSSSSPPANSDNHAEPTGGGGTGTATKNTSPTMKASTVGDSNTEQRVSTPSNKQNNSGSALVEGAGSDNDGGGGNDYGGGGGGGDNSSGNGSDNGSNSDRDNDKGTRDSSGCSSKGEKRNDGIRRRVPKCNLGDDSSEDDEDQIPRGVVRFLRPITRNEIRGGNKNYHDRAVKYSLHTTATRRTELQLRKLGCDLLQRRAHIDFPHNITQNYRQTKLSTIMNIDKWGVAHFSDKVAIGKLEKARLWQSAKGIQLGYISLRSDSYYIDRVFYLLYYLQERGKRRETWIKLVMLQCPMTDELMRFRKYMLRLALEGAPNLCDADRHKIELYLQNDPAGTNHATLTDTLLLKVYRTIRGQAAIILRTQCPIAYDARFATSYSTVATSFPNHWDEEATPPNCPLIILKQQRWSRPEKMEQPVPPPETVDFVLVPPPTNNKLVTMWDKGFPTGLGGLGKHYMPFFEAKHYSSFPLLPPLGLETMHMVPIRPLSQWKASDEAGDLSDFELPHNMWVERAFLHSYLEPYSPTNDFSDKTYWRVLCEDLYQLVLSNYDAVQSGLQIQEHQIFNDAHQLSCVSARASILSKMFNVKVILVRVQNGQPQEVILEHPHHDNTEDLNIKTRTVILGVDTMLHAEGSVYYSARHGPGTPADRPTQEPPTPEVFRGKVRWDHLSAHRKSEVASQCDSDIDSAFFACTDMREFSLCLVTEKDSDHSGTTANVYRHPRIKSNPLVVQRRYKIPLYINGDDKEDSSYRLQPGGDYLKKILCPLFLFPTLRIGQVTTPIRNVTFTMSITLIDTKEFREHQKLLKGSKKERQWTPEQVDAWKYILDKAVYKWKEEKEPTGTNPAVYAMAPQQSSQATFIPLFETQIGEFFSYLQSVCVSLSRDGVSQHPEATHLSKLLLHRSIFMAAVAGIKYMIRLHEFFPGGNGAYTWDGEELLVNQGEPLLEEAMRELLVGMIPNPSHCSVVGMDMGHTTRVAGGTLDLFPLHDKAAKKVKDSIEFNAKLARHPDPGDTEEPRYLIPRLMDFYRMEMKKDVHQAMKATSERLYGAAVRVKSKGYAVASLVCIQRDHRDNSYSACVTFRVKTVNRQWHFPVDDLVWTAPRHGVWQRAIIINLHHLSTHYPCVLCALQDGDVLVSKAPDCSGEAGQAKLNQKFAVLPVAFWACGSGRFQWQNPRRAPAIDSDSDEENHRGSAQLQRKYDDSNESNGEGTNRYKSSPEKPVHGDHSAAASPAKDGRMDKSNEKHHQRRTKPEKKSAPETARTESARDSRSSYRSSDRSSDANDRRVSEHEHNITMMHEYTPGSEEWNNATQYIMKRKDGTASYLLERQEAPMDGSCFFHSVLKHKVEGYQPKDHLTLRKRVIQHMEGNEHYKMTYESREQEEPRPNHHETTEQRRARERRNNRTYSEFLEEAKCQREFAIDSIVTATSAFLRCVF